MGDGAKRVLGEMWVLADTGKQGDLFSVLPTHSAGFVGTIGLGMPDDVTYRDRARFAACAPEAILLLITLEWDHGTCNVCFNTHVHAPECALDALLRKAGVR